MKTVTLFFCATSLLVLSATGEPPAKRAKPELDIRIIFDNTSARRNFLRSWGFSALIDFRGKRVLFDAGSDPILLLEHLKKMRIDPKTIDHAVISHQHGDHLRGVYWVFEKNPAMKVHFLDRFPDEAFRRAKGVKMKPHRVKGPFEVVPGIFSTGVVEGLPPEQSLVIETSKGMVMLVGCSHPGVVKLVETAQRQRQKKTVRLLMGGFHMHRQGPEKIGATIAQLQDLNVQSVVPSHCSGALAVDLFKTAYGKQAISAGAGRRIQLIDGQLKVSVAETDKQENEVGFVDLFDGKTLAGWQGATNVFAVEKGVLVCRKHGLKNERTNQNLYTTKQYSDFILRFEFKLEPGGNNGVAVRSPLDGRPSRDGLEIQILDDSAERYRNQAPHQYHGSIYLLAPAKRGHLKPVGQWNTEEIIFNGREAKVMLNGKVIVDVNLDKLEYKKYLHLSKGRTRKRGYLGFCGHSSRVEFRNIRIKEL